jgi:tRNA dimethylallyltransferase
MSLAEATAQGVRDTQAYAKRQVTWARHQLPGFTMVAPEDADALIRD